MAKKKTKTKKEPTPPFEQEEDAYDEDISEDVVPDFEAEETEESTDE